MKKYLTNKDIMQGDWLYPHNSNIPDKVFKIDTHMYMGGTTDCITFEKDKNTHHYTFMCNPVPLTTEILEKNGFRKSVSPPGIHAKCYEINNKDEKYRLTIANYNKYKRLLLNIDSEDSECFNIKCDYVHQLQHALRLCGIEKEIEL